MKKILIACLFLISALNNEAQVLKRKDPDVVDFFMKLPKRYFDNGSNDNDMLNFRKTLLSTSDKWSTILDKEHGYIQITISSPKYSQVSLKMFAASEKDVVLILNEYQKDPSCDIYSTTCYTYSPRNSALLDLNNVCLPAFSYGNFLEEQAPSIKPDIAYDENINFECTISRMVDEIEVKPVPLKSESCFKIGNQEMWKDPVTRKTALDNYYKAFSSLPYPAISLMWIKGKGKFEIKRKIPKE